MDWIWAPRVHYVMTVIHLTCAMFWLGWMIFFSVIMVPVLRREVPESFSRLRAIIQFRSRKVARIMIVLLVLTGLYNMAYRGLVNVRRLFYTEFGLWFILKLFLAVLLIGLYFLAPDFSQVAPEISHQDSSRQQRIATYVHGTILTLGLIVAYLGVGIGG